MTSVIKKIRRSLLLWHRRIGAIIAIFLLMLAVSGLMLNHTEKLQLGDSPVSSTWMMSLYGLEPPKIISYPIGRQWLSHLGGNYAYLNGRELAFCEQPFFGAVGLPEMMVLGCGEELLLLTSSGEEIERIDNSFGLPENVQGLAVNNDTLLVRAADQWYAVDSLSMQFTRYNDFAKPLDNQPLPKSLEQQLLSTYHGNEIHWERLLLDFHSGRLFGLPGVVWMDLVALSLIWVAGSGVWVWLTRPKRKN